MSVDFASLVMEVDSRKVATGVADLDKLTAAGAKAETSAKDLGQEWVRASSAAGKLRMEQSLATNAMQTVTASAGQQRAGMQQLSYQIGDVAQQFALGTNPMIIFAQQGGQVVQSLSLMKGGATGLVGFLAGPWGAIITGAAVVLAPFIAKLFDSGDAANKAAGDYRNAADAARDLIGATNALALNRRQMERNTLTERQFKLERADAIKWRGSRGAPGWQPPDSAALQEVKWQLLEVNNAISIAERENAKLEASARRVTTGLGRQSGALRSMGGAARGAASAVSAVSSANDNFAEDIKRANESLERSGVDAANRINAQISEAAETDWTNFVSAMNMAAGHGAQLRRDMDDMVESLERVNRSGLINALSGLGGLGGAGGSIGQIAGILASGGDKQAMANGFFGMGGPLGMLAGLAINPSSFRSSANGVSGGLQTLGLGSSISGTLGKGLVGASIGSGFGGLTGSSIGGGIGGAIGGTVGGKLLGKALGSSAGPIGSIIGGLLGGLIGGLFKKAKTGSSSVTSGGIISGGNNADARGNTGSIGSGVQTSLGRIIEALGGKAGDYGFSVGMRNDEYRVAGAAGADVTGKNPSGLLYKGKSAEEAARVALLNALNDGAVAGLREGASNLLKAGKDIEAALEKALQFNAVFDELAKETDPVKYATETLGKEMSKLKAIFDEAGASASDYAALEQLGAIKQARALAEAIRPQRELEIQIMRLEGKELEATNAERAMELAGLNATLKPLQERIYALTDEAAAVAKAAEAQAQLQKVGELEARLQEALGNSSLALAMRRKAELEAMDASLRGLAMEIYLAEDVARARDVLNDSYKRERDQLSGLAGDMRKFAGSLLGIKQSIFANDNGGALSNVRSALAGGDTGAASGAVRAYLDSARVNARSLVDYRREMGKVANLVDQAAAGASGAASVYEAQLAALDKSVAGLVSVDESVVSVEQAIADLNALLIPPTQEMAKAQADANVAAARFQSDMVAEVKAMRAESTAQALRMIELTSSMERFWKRAEVDGITIASSNTDPIITQVAA